MYRIGVLALAVIAMCSAGAVWADDGAACPAKDFKSCVYSGKSWAECDGCPDSNGNPLPPRPNHEVRIFQDAGPRPWFPLGLWVPTAAERFLAERGWFGDVE